MVDHPDHETKPSDSRSQELANRAKLSANSALEAVISKARQDIAELNKLSLEVLMQWREKYFLLKELEKDPGGHFTQIEEVKDEIEKLQRKIDENKAHYLKIADELEAQSAACIQQGADPNLITKDHDVLLVMFAELLQASALPPQEAQSYYKRVIETLGLNPNVALFSKPFFNVLLEHHQLRRNDKHLYDVIFEHEQFDISYGVKNHLLSPEPNLGSDPSSEDIHEVRHEHNVPGVLLESLYPSGDAQKGMSLQYFKALKLKKPIVEFMTRTDVSIEDKIALLTPKATGSVLRNIITNLMEIDELKDNQALIHLYDEALSPDISLSSTELYQSSINKIIEIVSGCSEDTQKAISLEQEANEGISRFIHHTFNDEKQAPKEFADVYRDSINENALEELRVLNSKELDLLKAVNDQYKAVEFSKQLIMYGHKMGLKGTIEVASDNHTFSVSLEGFNIVHTVPSVLKSIQQFREQNHSLHSDLFTWLEETYERYDKVTSSNSTQSMNWEEQAAAYKNGKPIIFESKWDRHSAMTVLYQDRIYICNKGAGTSKPSIKCYKIRNIDALIGPDVNTAQAIMTLSNTVRKDKRMLGELSGLLPGQKFSNVSFMKGLNLKREKQIALKGQKVGNCSYTNTKRGVHALMVAFQDRAKRQGQLPEDYPEAWKKTQNENLSLEADAQQDLYKTFSTFDKEQELQSLLTFIDSQALDKEQLTTTHTGVLEVLLLTLKNQNNKDNERNLNHGKKIVEKLKQIGFTDEDIVLNVMSRKFSQNNSLLYQRSVEANNPELAEDLRKNSKAQYYYQLIQGGVRLQAKEFLSKIGLNSESLDLTDDEKQVKAKIDKKVNDDKVKPSLFIDYYKEMFSRIKSLLVNSFRSPKFKKSTRVIKAELTDSLSHRDQPSVPDSIAVPTCAVPDAEPSKVFSKSEAGQPTHSDELPQRKRKKSIQNLFSNHRGKTLSEGQIDNAPELEADKEAHMKSNLTKRNN